MKQAQMKYKIQQQIAVETPCSSWVIRSVAPFCLLFYQLLYVPYISSTEILLQQRDNQSKAQSITKKYEILSHVQTVSNLKTCPLPKPKC